MASIRSTCWAATHSQQGQTVDDRLLAVVPAIEHGADRFDKGAVTGATLIALGTGLGSAKSTDGAEIHLPILRTARIPAQCAGMHKSCLFHHRPSTMLVRRS